MELQQQRSCVRPDDVPVLEDIPLDTTTQQRAVLQERSANWPHEFNPQPISGLKRSRSPSSPTGNIYARRAAPAGIYFTGNVHAQHIGLAGFGAERSEKQVDFELKRLYRMLQRSDKYQKYREKQPQLTVTEVLAKEAREAAEKKAREAAGGQVGKDEKDKTVWPEFLEHAFWRALVRWPPMGRKKFMLDGQLRGRNELIQDSIRRDTGITRDRKQVSSHLQVLKQHLHNQPGVLVYMATNDDDKKRHRGRESSHAYRLPEVRGRHQSHRAASTSKYDYDTPTSHLWAGSDSLPSSYTMSNRHAGHIQTTSPYSVIDFAMYVGIDDKQPVHFFTQLATDGKRDDLRITDTASWRRRLPEFEFLQPQMDDWSMQGREVIVCNASIKVMTESRPNASLSITFNLETQRDLSVFDSIECTTRFYDSGDMAPDPQFDGRDAHDLKEHRTPCDYRTGLHGRSGCLRIAFGSKFWVNRMSKYQILRHRNESSVSKSLLRLTATQDIYGIKPGTGEAEHLLTILWRFEQTRSSAEVGRMNWRTVNFDGHQSAVLEQSWNREKTDNVMKIEDMHRGHEVMMDCLTSAPHELSLYQQVSHLPLDYLQQPHNGYAVQATHAQHPPQLHLDVLASMQPDLEHAHASAAPSASTDYSQHSISNLSHSRDTVGLYGQDPNDFDFNGGHITISGAFDPTMNLHEYDHMANQSAGLDGLHALVGLDQDGYNLGLACAAGNELVDVGVNHDLQDSNLACYSTKPNLHHTNLISSLENQAENYYTYVDHGQATHGHDGLPRHHHPMSGSNPALTQAEDLVAHSLHDPHLNVNHSLWNLQSPFHEDTGGGASDGADCRKDSGVHGHGVGMGVLELIERDQRARGY